MDTKVDHASGPTARMDTKVDHALGTTARMDKKVDHALGTTARMDKKVDHALLFGTRASRVPLSLDTKVDHASGPTARMDKKVDHASIVAARMDKSFDHAIIAAATCFGSGNTSSVASQFSCTSRACVSNPRDPAVPARNCREVSSERDVRSGQRLREVTISTKAACIARNIAGGVRTNAAGAPFTSPSKR